MERKTELALIERALANIERGTTDAQGAPTRTPTSFYTAAHRFDLEREVLFRRHPIFVGFASQIREPGDFITHDLGETPILVTRGSTGEARAFVNACRHRGTRLEDAPCGRGKKRIVCPYHAWTYDVDGHLLAITHDEGFASVDRSSLGLIELPIAERHGMLFVRPTPGSMRIDDELGPFAADLATFDDHVLFPPSLTVRDASSNWKIFLDTSLETYHFEFLHKKTIAPFFHHNIGVFDWAEPHARMVLPKRSIGELASADRSTWSLRPHANLIYAIFPSTLVLVQPDHAMIAAIFPVAPNRSRIFAGMLIPEGTEGETAHWKKNEKIFWDAIDEDIAIGERIQRTLDARAIDELVFGSHEHLIARFHRAVDSAIGERPSAVTIEV